MLGGVQPASAAPEPDVNGDGVYDHKDAFIIGQRRNRYPRFFNCVNWPASAMVWHPKSETVNVRLWAYWIGFSRV